MDKIDFWRFENTASNNTEATLFIYGDIMTYDWGEWNFPDDVVPNKFKDELNALGDVGTINVRINSGGGSVFGAYAIMNLLKTHNAEIIVHIDGIAASAATLIAMAGDKIIAALGSVFMVHLPSTMAWGNANDIQKTIVVLNTITETMVDVYHAKTGIDKEQLRQMIEADTWLTGKEAHEKGFVDEVEDMEVEAYVSDDRATAFFNGINVDLGTFRNKERFVAMLPSKPTARPQPENMQPETTKAPIIKNQKEESIMTLAELQAKHPNLYAEAINAGVAQEKVTSEVAIATARKEGCAEGVTAERKRIKEIDDLAMPGLEAITDKAKYETGITAAECAMEIIKAQKEKGTNYLTNAKADAKEVENVPASGAPIDGDAEEEAILAELAERAKTLRG